MESEIIVNIEKLYNSFLFNAALIGALVLILVLVTVGVIKFKLLNSKVKQIALILLTAICSIGLMILQFVEISPVYTDYSKQSYVLIEDAKIVIKDGSSGGINSTNKVVVSYEDKVIELKMQTDYSLSTEVEYVGKIAYLEHSEYIVWYQFEMNN